MEGNKSPTQKGSNPPEQQSKEEVNAAQMKAESDTLRKKLMDQKALIGVLEQQSIKYDEVKALIVRLIKDFQNSGDMKFVENENLDNPFKDANEAISVLRGGINKLIEKHEKLASKFELEFSRNIFQLKQQLEQKNIEFAKAKENLEAAENARDHQLKIVKLLTKNKETLCHTVLLRRTALISHRDKKEKEITKIQSQLENASKNLENAEATVKKHDEVSEMLSTQVLERTQREETQNKSHEELVKTVEQLRITFRKEAHSHNCALSTLDIAKAELSTLQMKIDSYFDNLKTRELLEAEGENRKLQAVIKNEYDMLSRQKAVIDAKGRDIQNTISEYTEKIALLNEQITNTEQKLQTQMMRIPDFPQLKQALDRTLQQTKKHQEEVIQRKYLLDEIGDRNRLLDQMEIQASKDRMAQLKVLMPVGEPEDETEKKLPEILSERAKQQKELEELLTQPGF
ncbi:hypothetical protein TRFO_33222 [Tritrichomonas foetus]|uniref:Uncharacterized protein n=1 Tax=Tritrichomonas foetus TaxID=1144522 RepID=A0A1J4JM08_9EUKA|nr:hypothetical protein TRFO_33222 [Tritrichomonas foetus]|eukprot:OHT00153.1 hypothetical protein TRFO_33222 [Tritrichomonas foetus]